MGGTNEHMSVTSDVRSIKAAISANFISKNPNDYIKFQEIMNVVIVKCKGLMRNDRKLWQLLSSLVAAIPKY